MKEEDRLEDHGLSQNSESLRKRSRSPRDRSPETRSRSRRDGSTERRRRGLSRDRSYDRSRRRSRDDSRDRERGKDASRSRRRSRSSYRRRSWKSRSRSKSHSRHTRDSSRDRQEKKKKTSKWDQPSDEGFGFSQYGYPGMLPSMTAPIEDRRGRRLYIGNLPAGVSEQAIVQFFNGALLAAAGVDYSVAAASGQFPVLKAEIGPRRPDCLGQADHRYCFLEYRTIADANMCLKLDGISYNGFMLKVGRPNDYTTVASASEMSTAEALAAATKGVPSLVKLVQETKMYVQDLPPSVTDEVLRKIAERFGKLKSAALMKDLRTGQSMCCGVVEFENPQDLEKAVAILDRQPIDGSVPRFTRGPLIPAGGTLKSDFTGLEGIQTSSVVTELPTSMTHKVLSSAIVGAQVKAARQQGAIPSPVVQLLNSVFPEDLIKDEDYDAIQKDVREEATQYGTLITITIPRPPPDLSYSEGVGKDTVIGDSDLIAKIFLHFSDLTAARKAQAELNGRRFDQRRVICAAFYPLDKFLEEKFSLI